MRPAPMMQRGRNPIQASTDDLEQLCSHEAALKILAPLRLQAAQRFAAFIARHPDGIYTAAEARQLDDLYFWLTSYDAAEREAGRDDPL
jgi:hypothetical protein